MKKLVFVWLCWICSGMVWAVTPATEVRLLEELARLIEAGKNSEAYRLASMLRADMEGEPQFDLYYGIAAIDAGDPSEGVFALERVLISRPNHNRARLELARGYFAMGENERSLAEFNTVLSHNPPRAVRRNIESYIAAIDRRLNAAELRRKTYLITAFAELGLGYDTNVNAAPDLDNVVLPQTSGTLLSTSRQQADSFLATDLGAGVVKLLGTKAAISLNGRYGRVDNYSGFIDTELFELQISGSYKSARSLWRLSLLGQELWIDNARNQQVAGVIFSLNRTLNAQTQLNGFGRYAQSDFPSLLNRDSIGYSIGFGGSYNLKTQSPTSLFGSLYLGKDEPNSSHVVNMADAEVLSLKNSFGLQLGIQREMMANVTLSGYLQYQKGSYSVADPIFNKVRDDDYWHWQLNSDWRLSRLWSLQGSLGYTHNESNLVLRDYERGKVMLKLRYSR